MISAAAIADAEEKLSTIVAGVPDEQVKKVLEAWARAQQRAGQAAAQLAQTAEAKAQGSAGQSSALNPLSMQDLFDLPDEKLDWIWQDYIAEGDLAILTAYMKVGKSTLFYPLALSVARGQDFLDRPTKQGGVLILALEEHSRDVRLRFKKLGARAGDPIFVQSNFVPCTPEGVKQIGEFAHANNISLVIVDSLSRYWNITDENSNAEVQRKLAPLLDLAHTDNIGVLLIHHESKHGGRAKDGAATGDGRAVRGASSLLAVVDQALSLGRPKGGAAQQRVLRAIGRRSESEPELLIELWGNTRLSSAAPYGYRVIGTPEQQTKAEQHKKVEKLLTPQWLTIEEITEDALGQLSEKQVREALKALHGAGKAVRRGTGAKNNAFEYRVPLVGDPPNQGKASGLGAKVQLQENASGIRSQGSPNPTIGNVTNISEGL